jgi:hypothetical protein
MGVWKTLTAAEVSDEMRRARLAEQQKDETIARLASALRKARGFVHGRGDLSKAVRDEIDAALGAAGK